MPMAKAAIATWPLVSNVIAASLAAKMDRTRHP
jgi:hypothetical protein